MAVECQELKQRIAYGDPFFILYQEHKKGGAIVSEIAINRIPLADRSEEKCLTRKEWMSTLLLRVTAKAIPILGSIFAKRIFSFQSVERH